jgi:hypothetical protein
MNDPHGLQGSFLEKDNGHIPFDQELDEMKREAEQLEKEQKNMIRIKTEFSNGGIIQSFDISSLPEGYHVSN